MAFPNWVQALEKAPRVQVIGGSVLAAMALAGYIITIQLGSGNKVRTMEPDWIAANKEYMKFQNMNPISGISSKK